jgi:hypothetical protein
VSTIRLIPAHGDINIRPIFQSQLLSDISAHQAVVRDKGRPLTTAGLPKDIEVVTLKEPDIIHYLDDRACQARAPQFPGWSVAREQWNAAQRPEDLKSWCARQYDLRLNTRTVRELAAETRLRWGTPPELQQVLGRLKALASAAY